MGLALQVLSLFKLASDAVVKTVNSVFIPSLDTHEMVLARFYKWSFVFIASGYSFLLILFFVKQQINIPGYPTMLEDLALFIPSRVIMVLNLYASILITTLVGSKILLYVSFFTLVAYLIGLPVALELGGIRYIAIFDFSYNTFILMLYCCFLLIRLNLEFLQRYIIGMLFMLTFVLGYLRFL
jgi:hypothetical protein